MAMQTSDGGTSVDALVQRVLALPSPLASRIGAAAEALSLLAFCADFPVDCRLVAQAQRQASLLGRVQRDTARTTPLCVLVDIAALQRRSGALAACLRWLLRQPNLRALHFADSGSGSMLDEEELSLLLQLVAAHPAAAASLQHLGTWTADLGRQFDAGLLAPLTHLRSLELRWFCSADWPQLPLSVRSVSLQLPGCAYGRHRVPLQEEALAELPAAAEAVQQLLAEYEALGPVDPLPELPPHRLDELLIDADSMHLKLTVGRLFRAAAQLTVARGGTMQLVLQLAPLHMPVSCVDPQLLLGQLPAGAGVAQLMELAEVSTVGTACAYALLEAFRTTPSLQAAQLGARQWKVGLAGRPRAAVLHPQIFLHFLAAELRDDASQFGFVRAANAAPEEVGNGLPPVVPLQLSRSTVDRQAASRAAGRMRGAGIALSAAVECWALGLVLWSVAGLSGGGVRAWVRLGKGAALLGIPALLLRRRARQMDTL